MLLRRVIEHVKAQNWTAVALDFVIVVVGVFIGIQVSNWNEARQEEEQTERYLGRLADDLTSMQAQIRTEAAFAEQLHEGAILALNSLRACRFDPADEEKINLTFQAYQTAPAPYIYRATFDEMMSSGAFASLPNEQLKTRIASLYSSLDRFAAIVGYLRRDLSAAGQILWARIDFGYEELDGRQSHTADYDLAEFCDDRLFRNAIWELADTHRDWINFAESILEQVDAALIALEPSTMRLGRMNVVR